MRLDSKAPRKGWLAASARCSSPPAGRLHPVQPGNRADGGRHGSLLHVTGNITDLRARVTDWKRGNPTA